MDVVPPLVSPVWCLRSEPPPEHPSRLARRIVERLDGSDRGADAAALRGWLEGASAGAAP